jgi:hypothetical protein
MRFAIIVVSLVAVGAVAVALLAPSHHTMAVRPENAAGDTACLFCHREYTSFERTAHHLTSRLPTGGTLEGSFRPGENVLRTSNPALYFRMDSGATGYSETAVLGRAPDTSTISRQIAFVTGSRRGQSYLSWGARDRLYQLPISYWQGIGWAYSPGYREGSPDFGRLIPPRCLECHSSWFENLPAPSIINRYRRTGAILGITCEKCHGSGREHARRERSPLRWLLPRAIVNPARLSRARQLDGCGLCHGGATALRSKPFDYVPGQPLEKRIDWRARPDTGVIDVHGNQVALLERSKCFRSSRMTCTTCHDVHHQQRDIAVLSGRCLTCHTVQSCGLSAQHGAELEGRCVDCHMPALESNTIISTQSGHPVRILVRTHWIKVYPQHQSP